jgi:hypothetical protein
MRQHHNKVRAGRADLEILFFFDIRKLSGVEKVWQMHTQGG